VPLACVNCALTTGSTSPGYLLNVLEA
jgi:hypothetical protein